MCAIAYFVGDVYVCPRIIQKELQDSDLMSDAVVLGGVEYWRSSEFIPAVDVDSAVFKEPFNDVDVAGFDDVVKDCVSLLTIDTT